MFAGPLAPYSYQGITGKEYDPKSGLVNFGARWYDPAISRFTQADTFKGFASQATTQHPYAYVGNNPINRFDPTGHAEFLHNVNLYVDGVSAGQVMLYSDWRTYFSYPDEPVRAHYESMGYTVTWDGSAVWAYSPSGGGGDNDGGYEHPPEPTPEERRADFNQAAGAVPSTTVKSASKTGQPQVPLKPNKQPAKGQFGAGTAQNTNNIKVAQSVTPNGATAAVGTQAAKQIDGQGTQSVGTKKNTIGNKTLEALASPIAGKVISAAGFIAGTAAFAGVVVASAAVVQVATIVGGVIAVGAILHSASKVYTGKSTWKKESVNVGVAVAGAATGLGSLYGGVLKPALGVFSWGLSNATGIIGMVSR